MLDKKVVTMRFKDAPWFNNLPSVTIVGAGGIGSWSAVLLGRAGCKAIGICDMDIYEEHNLGGQLFINNALGQNKASALVNLMKNLGCTSDLHAYCDKYSSMYSRDHMIAAVDNMAARKQMFEDWKKRETRKLFIDGRLLAEHFQIFCVTPGTEKAYEEHLFDDSEVNDEACSYKQTSHAAAAIGSYICSFFINHSANVVEGAKIYHVPFYYENVMSIGLSNLQKDVKLSTAEFL